MTKEQINDVANLVKGYLAGADIGDAAYYLLVADAFKALISANDLLQEGR